MRYRPPQILWSWVGALLACLSGFAIADDTRELKSQFRRANGGIVRLKKDHTYEIREKLELKSLCPDGVKIDGRGATIRALPGFRHGVLLTANVLLRDAPYDAGVFIRNLRIDGNGQVGRCVFGNWKDARIDELYVTGGTVYQINAIWQDSMLTNIHIDGNATQTNNGFDCSMQRSTIYNVTVNMHGNLLESAFWLNGCKNATVINAELIDGRTAFGLENCRGVDVVNLKVRGELSFRLANILPADPSERIHLYNVDFAYRHIGKDASTGVHFNATKGGLVAGGKIRTPGPGVLLTHGASDVAAVNLDLPRQPIDPIAAWERQGKTWRSRNRTRANVANHPPVVFAGPKRIEYVGKNNRVLLQGIVADETPLAHLKVQWLQTDGPDEVVFETADQAKTRAHFPRPGIYRLALAASDGQSETRDELVIKIARNRRVAAPTARKTNSAARSAENSNRSLVRV